MSNPTLLVETFESSSGSFSVTGPERYDSGLWLEEGTTNGVTNPSFETNAASWGASTGTGNTVTRVVAHPADGVASLNVVGTGAVSAQGAYNNGGSVAAVTGDVWTLSSSIYSASGGESLRFMVSERDSGGTFVADTPGSTFVVAAGLSRYSDTITLVGGGGVGMARFKLLTPTGQAIDLNFDACQMEKKSHVTSYTASTRAASSASVTIAEPAAVACWYREGYSGAKTFAYLEPYGTLGTYGSIAYAAGDLTISTSRNLVIGPFAAFDRELTANEQANLRSTQNWSMNSVNGSNIILPLSGRRRPR